MGAMSSAGLTNPVQIRGTLLVRNSVLNFIGQAVPLLVGVATIPYIIHGLGTERFGILALAWVLVASFSVFNLGLGQATTKFVAELLGKGETRRLPPLVWTSLILHALFGTIAGLVLAAVTPVLVERLFQLGPGLVVETRAVFLILAMSLPIVFVTGVFRGVLGAAQRFDLVNAVNIPSSSLSYLIPAAAVLLGFGLPAIVLFFLIARLATALVYLVLCLRIFPGLKHTFSFDRKLLRPLLSYGGWVTVSSVVGPVLVYADRFLIGALISMTAVAYYTAPYEVVIRLWILPISLTATLFPAFSALGGAGDQAQIKKVAVRSLKYLLLMVGPTVFALVFFAREILHLWLGGEFAQQSTLVFQILAVGVLVNSLAQLPSSLLQGLGRPDIPAKFHLLELPLHVALAWFLIGRYGIAGAALAWTLRVALDGLLLWAAAWRLNRMSLRIFAENGLLRSVFALSALGGTLLTISFLDNALVAQAAHATVLMVSFALAVWAYVLDSTEKRSLTVALNQLRLVGARTAR